MIHFSGSVVCRSFRRDRILEPAESVIVFCAGFLRAVFVPALLLASQAAYAQFGVQPVASPTAAQAITVTAQAAGTVTSVGVLTLGVSGLDFAPAAGSTCQGATLAKGASCTQPVIFTPAAPGKRIGAVVLLGSGGPIGTAYLSGTGLGGLGVFVPGNVLPVAGNGNYLGAVLDGNAATQAELYLPTSMALDGAGNLYIADSLHNRIREVTASTGVISTIAGNGNPAYSGDGGAATGATLNTPSGVAIDGAGNLYIADTGNSVVRRIDAISGVISTVAGIGPPTLPGYNKDGVAATAALLNLPQGVTVDASGNLYIADTGNHRIRMVAIANGIISTVAGNGYTASDGTGGYSGDGGPAGTAKLNSPYAVVFDAAGNMYIPDSANNRVRKVAAVSGAVSAAGIISTFAGTGVAGYNGDGALATAAQLWAPSGIAIDPAGNVFIADTQNSAIRKVAASTSNISTLVKNGNGSYYFGQAFVNMAFYGPTGLLLDGAGNLYVADSLDMVVRKIQANFVAINYVTPVRQGSLSSPVAQTVENDGNAALDLSQIVPDANSALDAASTSCKAGSPFLSVAATCTVGAVFAPSTSGNPLTANIDLGVKGDTVNAPLDIELVGDATAVNSTTITLTSSLNPAGFGQNVTFTATVTTGSGTGNLTGTVTFYDGATVLAANVPLAAPGATATATFVTASLAVGKHAITAAYSGDSTHFASNSTDPKNTVAPLSQVVVEGTTTTLASSANPANVGQSVTFTATISSTGGAVAPDGTVTFFDGMTLLGAAVINSSGIATVSTSALAAGVHSITATYGGDARIYVLGSASLALQQSVQAPSTVAVSSSLNPSYYGNFIAFTATVLSGASSAATGKVNFYDGTQLIGSGGLSGTPATATITTSGLAAGTHSITAVYAGDSSNGSGTSSVLTQIVNKTVTLTALAAAPNPGIAGVSESITAAVTLSAGASTPTGTVTFTSGTTTLGTASLGSQATATINVTLTPGTYSIVASYPGDTNDGSSVSAAFPLTVVQATTQTSISVSPNPAIIGSTVTYTVKVTGNGGIPTGSVSVTANSKALGPATLDSTGTATMTDSSLSAGSYTVKAVYAGDANDQGSSGTAPAPLVIQTIPTATALGSASTTGTNPVLVLVATVTGTTGPAATGTVVFTSGSTTIGSALLNASGVATLMPNLAPGSYSIVAAYGGDSSHSASTSQPLSVSTTNTTFAITLTPPSVSIVSSQNTSVTINLSSSNGFTDTIGLGCASLPAGVNCHFSPISVTLPANGIASAQVTIDTNNPLRGGLSASNRVPRPGGLLLAGFGLLPGVLLSWIVFRFRRRNGSLLASMAVALLATGLFCSALLASGCNGITQSSAAPGTYVIQITGTGTSSNVIHYASLTLTITN
jgi:sugar lactone lactonase YvrE